MLKSWIRRAHAAAQAQVQQFPDALADLGQPEEIRQPQIDGCRRKASDLQFIAVAENDGATERQSGFGAVPGNEVAYGEGVGSFRSN